MELEYNEIYTSLDTLPEDPLAMPPPYWKGTDAIYYASDALRDLTTTLKTLLVINKRTAKKVKLFKRDYHEEYPAAEAKGLFRELAITELEIKKHSEIAIFMCAIALEDEINCFCVYNLHKDIAESIERLSLPEKLLIAAASVGEVNTKGTVVFESIKKLNDWRNAFAHGHVVGRTTKSLRNNHLIHPTGIPNLPKILAETIDLVSKCVNVYKFLASKSKNPYMQELPEEITVIEDYIQEISKYKVEFKEDVIYIISYSETTK